MIPAELFGAQEANRNMGCVFSEEVFGTTVA